MKVHYGAMVAIDKMGNPIDDSETGVNIFYYGGFDLKISRSLVYDLSGGGSRGAGKGSSSYGLDIGTKTQRSDKNFTWEDADNIGDMMTSFVDIPSLAGGISRMNMGSNKTFSQLRRVVSSEKFLALKQYNKVLGAAGKILGVAGLVTSIGEAIEEPFSWTNWAKVGVNVATMGLKSTPLGLTISMTIGLLDATGYLDKGFGALFNEKSN